MPPQFANLLFCILDKDAPIKIVVSFPSLLVTTRAFPFDLRQGYIVIQLGSFISSEGKVQNINIQDLVGDHFRMMHGSGNNGLVGVDYFLDF